MNNNDNIVAIATANGKGSIGVIRISGPNLINIIGHIFKQELYPRKVYYLPFLDKNEIIDRGIVIFFKAPNSYTGEDVLELQCHGGIYVTRLILECLLKNKIELNLRLADPGEFTKRAFLNGKIDLTQAEAISDLINAKSKIAVKSANISLSGKFSYILDNIQKNLINIQVIMEANLDFSEEEIEYLNIDKILNNILEIKKEIKGLIHKSKFSFKIREGINVALIGKPNVGKSSLLNKLIDEEVAIVTPFAGTTRDVITKTIYIDGFQINLMDTAGIHDTKDPVEKIGIKRSMLAIKKADIILNIHDIKNINNINLKETIKLPKYKTINVFNKIDLIKTNLNFNIKPNKYNLYVSVKKSIGLEDIKNRITQIANEKDQEEIPWLARKRHVECLKNTIYHLDNAYNNLIKKDNFLELSAEEIRLAQNNINAITGKFTNEDLLGEIFSSFCIGK
ncbi:tRNA modification GTPase MnmE [Candidatus Kinetoplastibacterium sorsogonicusi]|uniref:tRNA modification GTPase MnmE n=1 Tax=Candidatus Kinetoplastidibacterium kentomonadis TaxID=1576550 RepID=A0A3S7JAW6_9PROT|nr:tRNA uridine-5-carboxymethylaminomethyl(34) synthesis GTPase MnmE [Candidatus Kinetoplastibacterium sorsogonicusi]AWD32813.1 tRNA modification GTPase MnmE [Candidatus Kinetoplastibacterium sorsogonicusi]